MAKTKTTKTPQKETVKATAKTTALLRKGALAYVGLYGAAYERAKFRADQVRNATDGLFDSLVVKGENIEGKATVFAKDAQVKVVETFTTTTSKVRGVLPKASNDRVEELETEITKLNKKISAMAKKKATKAVKVKTAKVKTEKAPAYTNASLSKMLEKDVVALAIDLGIEASVDDLKADTIAKILAKTAAPIAA